MIRGTATVKTFTLTEPEVEQAIKQLNRYFERSVSSSLSDTERNEEHCKAFAVLRVLELMGFNIEFVVRDGRCQYVLAEEE